MTARAPLPNDVADFLRTHIDSVELLEVLLILMRHAGKSCSAEEIRLQLRTAKASVSQRLQTLSERGFCICLDMAGDVWTLECDAGWMNVLQSVARCYRERRVSTIELIFSRPKSSLQDFSDAFDFRKGGSD